MNYLGLDYGLSHIGVAIATSPLAEPLTTIDTKHSIQLIKDLIKKHSVDEIVIGDAPPDYLKDIGIPVHIVDETLTSHDARESLFHTTQKRRQLNEHSVAAALILQSFLDSRYQNA